VILSKEELIPLAPYPLLADPPPPVPIEIDSITPGDFSKLPVIKPPPPPPPPPFEPLPPPPPPPPTTKYVIFLTKEELIGHLPALFRASASSRRQTPPAALFKPLTAGIS
jgi:hypothetical protein